MSKTIVLTLFIELFLQCQCQNPHVPGFCSKPPSSCPPTKYRSFDGSCNNLGKPILGMLGTTYGRLCHTNYGNGIDSPTTAKSGKPLPGARQVSIVVYPDRNIEDPDHNLLAMQYGQTIAHDMSLTMGNNQTKQLTETCCSREGQLLQFASDTNICYPILVPPNDPVYSKENISCFEFQRTGTDREFGCGKPNQPVQQLSLVNHYLDLSHVYGLNANDSDFLRLFQGGKLKFETRIGQNWLPRSKNVTGTCIVAEPSEPCYLAGDVRANQNPQLAILQTVLLRDHNRIATILTQLNPTWDDEKTYQETRKICIAIHQYIIYYEWLPIFLGEENVLEKKISYKTNGFVNDYNSTVDPSVLNEHANAAFRFFHTNIAGHLDYFNEKRKNEGDLRLSDWFNRPAILEKDADMFNELTIGFTTQRQHASDRFHDKEITNNWLRPIGKKLGQDLKAICVQRNRDHGLASYNDLRVHCGLKRACKFEDFEGEISKENVRKLKSLYEHVDDVDLTVGGSLEKLEKNTQAGPTFLCIITEQFFRTRVGDRFFFENCGELGFTLAQLREIRKSSISKILCDNTNIKSIQPQGFRKISGKNKVTSCQDLPSVNLTLWKEK